MDDDQLRNLFAYHIPTPGQVEVYRDLRDAAYEFARVIDRLCPAGSDRTAAIRKVREAVMTANAALDTRLSCAHTLAARLAQSAEQSICDR